MRKYLFLFLISMLLNVGTLFAQVSYMGAIPEVEEMHTCDEPVKMSDEEAWAYLNGYIQFFDDECNTDLHITTGLALTDTKPCYRTYLRVFVITDACGHNLGLTQQLKVYDDDHTLDGTELPHRSLDKSTVEEAIPPASVVSYLESCYFYPPSCWGDDYTAYYDEPEPLGEGEDCRYRYRITFHVEHTGCDDEIVVYQEVDVIANDIPYTGTFPMVAETESCYVPEPMNPEEAITYVTSYIEIIPEEDCSYDYEVECTISDDPVEETTCYTAFLRTFRIHNDCGLCSELNQILYVYHNDDTHDGQTLPERSFDAFHLYDAIPYESEFVIDYLLSYGIEPPECWDSYTAEYEAVAVGIEQDCSLDYDLTFHMKHYGCEQEVIVYQRVVLAPTGLVRCPNTVMDPMMDYNCNFDDEPGRPTELRYFESFGVEFFDYLLEGAFTIEKERVEFEEQTSCSSRKGTVYYKVSYACTNQEFIISQEFEHRKILEVTGKLKSFRVSDDLPAPYSKSELQQQLTVHTTCGAEDWDFTYYDSISVTTNSMIIRKYCFRSISCPDLRDTIMQFFTRYTPNPQFFKLESVADCTEEGAKNGQATLSPPAFLNCSDYEGEENKMFIVEWINHSKNEHMYRSDPNNPETNIYYIDTLDAGQYTVRILPNCPTCEFEMKPIFTADFKINEMETHLLLQPNVCLFSTHSYLQLIGMHVVTHDAAGHAAGTLINSPTYPLLQGFQYVFESDDGEILPKSQWQMELENPAMHGNGFYEQTLSLANNVDLAIGKDVRNGASYFAYRGEKLVKSVHRNLYEEKLFCSDDPNEIFGPAGYTDADSLCVRMINTTDDVPYTIMFENDPEFATAAAARVKVECPLSDKIDPTTFRLGNFGFNNMTFEVPELASYYNQRLQLDSLGYWLDVTASIQVPGNIAYWIFQTIDPATGVAPIDSMGFLPINDTLTGCGEGFVTFTAGLANNGTRGIQTGDEILERADIYFDENDVVPTNDYINQFDAVAPTSTVLCDTVGAYLSHILPIRFSSQDDQGGSGVHHVNLYASLDHAGYELIGQIHPDSVFRYPTTVANMLEFFSQAVDNTGNTEDLKTLPELVYTQGQAPMGLSLSNNRFEENASIYTAIGEFSTLDDQTSDDFVYQLVSGEGSTDNISFSIQGNRLVTNRDFRCYGMYDYNIRVRTTDLSGLFLEKAFTIHANRTEEVAPVTVYENLCPGESIIFGNERITTGGVYEHTFSNYLGCDSLVYMNVTMNEVAPTAYYEGDICRNYAYDEHGFDLSAETIATLTQGWSMASDTTIFVDNYKDNAFGCTDTLRLALTVKPAFDIEDNHLVCPSDLPYVYKNRPYVSDTTVLFSYTNTFGCDSIVRFNLTLNPDYGTQSDDLAGWSWYSTYIDQSNGRGLKNLENELGSSGNLIKSKTSFVQYYPEQNLWYGTLSGIDNESMFMINTSSPVTADITGCYASVAACEIPIRPGWNWIGYPSNYTTSVEAAMSGLAREPKDGDVLKSKSSFTTYYGEYGLWYGSLGMLTPGEGYMYMSNDNAENMLVYPSATRDQGAPVALQETFWQANEHKFARNITFVGAIELDGNIIESDTLEVGVFCHGEKRGSGRAIYLDRLGEYRIFLTAHGEDGDELNFRLYDHEKNKERRIRNEQQVVFHDDDNYGNIGNPYLFVFNTDYDKLIEAEICDGQYYVENGFRAYRSGTYFNELPNDSIIRLDLTVNPVYHEEKSVVAFEFPFHYDDMTFDAPGTYNLQYNTAEECDSTLVLTVQPYDGVRELLISPVPAERSQRVTLFFPFTADEQHDLLVEVYTLGGNLMQTHKPKHFPIELDPFAVSGTYMVKITMGTGEVLTGKIIVK